MSRLEHKSNILENGGIETAIHLKSTKNNKFLAVLRNIKKLILGKSSNFEKNDI